MPQCKICKVIVQDHPTAAMLHLQQSHPPEYQAFNAALMTFGSVLTARHFEIADSMIPHQDQAVERLEHLIAAIVTERAAEAEVRVSKIYQAHTELREDPKPAPGTPRKPPGRTAG